jgi:hypothetical protein
MTVKWLAREVKVNKLPVSLSATNPSANVIASV